MLIGYIVALLIGFGAGYFVGKWVVDDLNTINKTRDGKRDRRINQLYRAVKSSESYSTSQAVELLGVSERTARNYFDELEAKNLIIQVGETGRSVHYKLKR